MNRNKSDARVAAMQAVFRRFHTDPDFRARFIAVKDKLIDLKECLLGDRILGDPTDCDFCGYVVAGAGAA